MASPATKSIRFIFVNTPAGGSVFKLQHQHHHDCCHLHQAYQLLVCKHLTGGSVFKLRHQNHHHLPCHHLPTRSISFMCANINYPAGSEAPFSSFGTKTITTVTTFSLSVYRQATVPEALCSSYGTILNHHQGSIS